ncbi:MAG: plasmid mobilization relaxosome protein MobC [Bdellovibrionales bacterium]|nr:plasmid mobilization relaxosome protein MobC [Bdellovibrionales bacterium]
MNTKPTTQTKTNTFVRFKTPEYQLITEDSQKTNLSIPTLLKKSYFSKRHQFKLINTEEIKPIIFHLSKIGNNMNQIAKHLNAGIRNGFNTEYDNMAEEFRKVQQVLVTVYGLR